MCHLLRTLNWAGADILPRVLPPVHRYVPASRCLTCLMTNPPLASNSVMRKRREQKPIKSQIKNDESKYPLPHNNLPTTTKTHDINKTGNRIAKCMTLLDTCSLAINRSVIECPSDNRSRITGDFAIETGRRAVLHVDIFRCHDKFGFHYIKINNNNKRTLFVLLI